MPSAQGVAEQLTGQHAVRVTEDTADRIASPAFAEMPTEIQLAELLRAATVALLRLAADQATPH